MSYDPTERAPQPPDQQPPYGQAPQPPSQPPTPPTPGQSNPGWQPYGQPPATPAYGQAEPTQAAMPPAPGQSNPGWPPYGQPPVTPAYGQSNPSWPAPGADTQAPTAPAQGVPAYGQSNPNLPPAYGQSNPNLPSYEQTVASQSNPNLPPYGQAPTEQVSYPQYAQPTIEGAYPQAQPANPYAAAPALGQPGQPGQPWAPGMPPAYPVAPAPKKKHGLLIAIISIIVVVLVVAGGVIGYVVTRPKPVINVTSTYHNGSALIGASGTAFTVTGNDFTGNSTVTFLLDGSPAPGVTPAQSDSKGNVTATLNVSSAWSVGNHKITAKDAAGYLTQLSHAVTIVVAGQDDTPGPNGAPTDSASGSIDVTAQGETGGSITLTVTGSPDGGTVCAAQDDGKPHTNQDTSDGIAFTETIVYTCKGTYKGGQLSYTETVTQATITDAADGLTCTAKTPFVNIQLQGTFSSNTSVSGTYTTDAVTFNCNMGVGTLNAQDAGSGSWTGNASMQATQ